MKPIFLITILLALILSLMMVGCASPSPTAVSETQPRNESMPTSMDTVLVPTNTVISSATPSPTSTPTSAPSETPTSSPTKTSTQTPTYTPEPPLLTLKQDTACFSGAHFGHRIHEYVLEGEQFLILAALSDQTWWLVEYDAEESCWIFGQYAQTSGVRKGLPVLTPPPLPTVTMTATPTTAGIYYILIAEDTGGPFGCGDSLIKYYPGVWIKGDREADIVGALNALFSNHNQYVGGLYNPIYESRLKAKSVEEVGSDVVVQIAGTLVRPKNACESKRMHDQIWYTIGQFTSTRAVVYLNNALLGDLLVVTNK